MGRTRSPIRKEHGTTTAALDGDIKTAALEALVPSELEQHLAMSSARLITFEQVRSEIQAHTEARRGRFAFKRVAAKNTSDPMDVDSFGKGGEKGKKGKGECKNGKKRSKGESQNPNPSKDVCGHSGKKGHLSTESWSNPKNPSGCGGMQHKGAKRN